MKEVQDSVTRIGVFDYQGDRLSQGVDCRNMTQEAEQESSEGDSFLFSSMHVQTSRCVWSPGVPFP